MTKIVMSKNELCTYLIQSLIEEDERYKDMEIPDNEIDQKVLLRALMNVRPVKEISEEFLSVQDEYLRQLIKEKGIVELHELEPIKDNLYLWQGDITRLKCGAIVNAANSGMTGCYYPNHGCIDNCIHTFAGIQLRLECSKLICEQGYEEPTGQAKITSAYNLPSDYILHTVGPIIMDKLMKKDESYLESCYVNCLKLAENNKINSIAFCCISTGEFRFPNERAAEIAVDTVLKYLKETNSEMKVIFNVFKEKDYNIYRRLLDSNN